MADITFNTNAGETVAREMLIAYLNTGEEASPESVSYTHLTLPTT